MESGGYYMFSLVVPEVFSAQSGGYYTCFPLQ